MLSAFFEHTFFLQSLGWAIANSFWQVALLWVVYKLITGSKQNSSAPFKHNLSFALLMLSVCWFIATILQSYGDTSKTIATFSISASTNNIIITVLPYIAVVYVVFLIAYLIRFSNNFFKIAQLKNSHLLKPNIDIRIFVTNTALHLGITKKVQVWLSDKIDVPSVIGFFKPAILLPAAAIAQLTTEQLESVLLHELAHIKRQDFLLNLLHTIAKLILFFNPFAALLSKQIETERENCCDDWVLNHQYNRETYANALLQIETYRQEKVIIALAATNGKKQLLNRIKRLFNAEPNTFLTNFQKVQIATVCVSLLIACVLLMPAKTSADEHPVAEKDNIILYKNVQSFILPIAQINNEPIRIKETPKTKTTTATNIVVKANTSKKDNDYSVALINEELLQAADPEAYAITNVSDKEDLITPKYYVKIEEEKSGNKNNSVYYFQLSNDSGKATVKPIIFLNKPVKKISKKMPDTSIMPGKKITS
ncbi:M56 family metallopeptidase [Ferruginibacter sp. SUN002]|uniref:M56 family metallopeptidase n=1 Tax=Ferruginibacter sp. SUN002 TaxID=2937789 RepID=UPI003D367D6E